MNALIEGIGAGGFGAATILNSKREEGTNMHLLSVVVAMFFKG